jgi:hypothetical protein
MIVHDLDRDWTCRTARPLEADPPPVVDSNAVLPLTISTQFFETVARQNREVSERGGRLEAIKLQSSRALDPRKRRDTPSGGE